MEYQWNSHLHHRPSPTRLHSFRSTNGNENERGSLGNMRQKRLLRRLYSYIYIYTSHSLFFLYFPFFSHLFLILLFYSFSFSLSLFLPSSLVPILLYLESTCRLLIPFHLIWLLFFQFTFSTQSAKKFPGFKGVKRVIWHEIPILNVQNFKFHFYVLFWLLNFIIE